MTSTMPSWQAQSSIGKDRAGNRRTVAPAETLERFGQLLPAMGITRLGDVTGLDRIGIPVVMVSAPNARSLAVAQGRGLTLEAAKVSGMMEAAEAYHAGHTTLPLKLNAWDELRFTHQVQDPRTLRLLAGARLDPLTELLWIEGRDMQLDESVWLPFEVVAFRDIPSAVGGGCFLSQSSGLAAGNDLLEATVHALCELIERDARTLWRFRSVEQQASRRVDLSTVEDKSCRETLDLIEQAGLLVGAWDVTTDIRIPTIHAEIVERNPSLDVPYFRAQGSGCHRNAAIALIQALTEAAQARLTLIAGSRDDLHRRYYRVPDLERRRALCRTAESNIGGRPFQDIQSHPAEHLAENLRQIVKELARVGLPRAIAVDLTRIELGIPVVRVVVPGLEDGELVADYVPGERLRRLCDSQ